MVRDFPKIPKGVVRGSKMMNFCYLDHIPEIPAKPPKLTWKKIFGTFLGPHQCSGANFSKLSRTIFPKSRILVEDPFHYDPAKFGPNLSIFFCAAYPPPGKNELGQGPKRRGKSEKVGVL